MPRVNKPTLRLRATNVIAGIAKRFAPSRSYTVAGKDYSPAQMSAPFREVIQAMDDVRKARAVLTIAVARQRKATQRAAAFARNLRFTVESLFGSGPDAVADFGWAVPKKRGPKTVKAKLAVAEKGAATRAARKTLGKRQRQKIRGEVTPRAT